MRHHCNNQFQVHEIFLWLQLDQINSSLKPLWEYLSGLEYFELDYEAAKQTDAWSRQYSESLIMFGAASFISLRLLDPDLCVVSRERQII